MLVESNGDFYWNFEGLTVSLKVVPRVRMEVLVFFSKFLFGSARVSFISPMDQASFGFFVKFHWQAI